ncbi:Ubiquitin carboxyl-terminal hydrolase 4 [Hypsibius exemplaris]|uniref:Ubiquitin carboxyl-terminal hydrolase n=1 Tax=Hypsibius exemplaris TaxID=2072580 RepID=A0A1W0XAE6_HYPEX|nr:Ubiquitin carboxyl-terminal hydrolase 4 [Hypsibius exemplaris]
MVTSRSGRNTESRERSTSSSVKEEPMDTSEPVAPASPPVGPEELRKIVAEAALTSMEPDETWYIISAKWFDQLKAHLAEGAWNETTNPGSVDNSELITKFDGKNELREGAIEKVDYEIIPQKLWNTLVSLFGGGGEDGEIVVRTYENSLFEIKVETRPLVVNCCLYPDIVKIVPIHVSRSLRIEECAAILMEKFDLSQKENTRFWVFSPDGTFDLRDEDTKKPLSDLDLTIKHLILVEQREEGRDDWTLDDKVIRSRLVADLKKQTEATDAGPSDKKIVPYNLRSHSDRPRDISSGGPTHGLVGLGNLGNTCFMNSSLQCLSNIPELTAFFRSGNYEKDINPHNPMGRQGDIARIYASLVDELWNDDTRTSVYPNRFKSTLSRQTSLFNGAQQDAQESLQYIVDCLHEDLSRVKKKPYTEYKDPPEGTTAQKHADDTWALYRGREDSIIVDLFHGQIRSSIKCPDCKKLSVTFDPVVYYSLPLPTNNMKKLAYTFIPYETNGRPSAEKLIISKNSSVEELLKKISEQVRVNSEYLVLVTLYEHRVTHVRKDKPCDDFSDRDRILVYQTAQPLEDRKFIPVLVYLRKLKDPSKVVTLSSGNGTLFEYPFMLSLPAEGLFARKLYHLVFSKLGRKLHAPTKSGDGVVKTEAMEQDNPNDGENRPPGSIVVKTDDEDASAAEDVEQVPSVPDIFTVSSINAYGSMENQRYQNVAGERVTFLPGREHFLSVNFEEAALKKYWKDTNDMPAEDLRWAASGNRSGPTDLVELRDCFQLYTCPERLGQGNLWRCPVCKEEKAALKKLDFWRLPKYMFVHLKRFQYSRFYREKLSTKVKFPRKGLDLSELLSNPLEVPALYDLVAISCHSGGLGGGHYWAVCKNAEDNAWYKFDDTQVRPASDSDIENETNPYILVYRRRTVGGGSAEVNMEVE